jgi:hypothetical protein
MNDIIKMLKENLSVVAISKRLKVTRGVIYDFLHRLGIEDVREFRRSIKFNQSFFSKIDTEEKAYWLGFVCADGCVYIKHPIYRIQIHLNNIDFGHLKKWHKSIESCQNVTKHGETVNSAHHSQQMCEDLICHGCVPRKSLVLRFPVIHPNLIRHFIRGYFDGDGSIYWHKNKGQYNGGMRLAIVGTQLFLETLQDELRKVLNVKPKKLFSRIDHPLTFQLVFGGYQESKKIAEWMYNDASIFLDRKQKRYVEFCKAMEKKDGC